MSFDWRDRHRTGARRLGRFSSQSLAVEGDTGSHWEERRRWKELERPLHVRILKSQEQ